MAKQTINIGSAELAGDGESLRSAFDKINDNFDELYISSGGGIALTDLSISTNPAGTAALSYNNTTGVFTYTPPDLSSFSTFDGDYDSLTNKPTIPAAGIALGDLSVGAEDPASGDGGISYDNTTGVFTYAPPDLSQYQPVGNLNADIDAHLNTSTATSNEVLSWDGSDYAWVAQSSGSSLNNIQDETYGVSVTGKIAVTTIDIGTGGINAQPGGTYDLQGTTIHFGSATIAGGSAFNPVINNHLWSGSTAPTDGYVLSWDASALSGNGDYSWVAQSADTLQDVTTRGATTTDLIDFQAGMTVGGADLHILNHGILEQLVQVNNPTGVVTYDCNATNVWWNIQPAADWTANFININVPLDSARNVTLAIIQESQPFIPSAVQIMGAPQTIRWQGGTPPTGTANGVDVVSFSIIVIGATYHILGQLVDFS